MVFMAGVLALGLPTALTESSSEAEELGLEPALHYEMHWFKSLGYMPVSSAPKTTIIPLIPVLLP